jgi:hypothetical protein
MDSVLFGFSLVSLLLAALATFTVAIEVGFRLGRHRFEKADETEKSLSSALQAAILGLLALLIGFTFAMAVARHDQRRSVLLEQANAIGTAELRSRLLAAAHAEAAAPLFREYVDAWIDFRAAMIDIAAATAAEERAAGIEGQLWEIARAATVEDPHSIPAGLFAAAMNDVIDMHERRHRATVDRVPEAVILLLFGVATLALGQVAYTAGLGGHRRHVATFTFALLIALVMVVILDIDRPRRGLIQVSQESLLRLQESLRNTPP